MLVRWIITSETTSSRRSSTPPNMSRSSCFHAALAVEQIDRAAQFLARRQDLLILADRHPDACLSSQRTSASIAIRTGPNNLTNQYIGRRNRERDAVGRVERRGLRQNLGEHDDDDGHDHRGIDHAGIAEPGQQHAGRERRGGDIDRVVAEQQRAEQPLALLPAGG